MSPLKIKLGFHGSLKKYNNDLAEIEREISIGTAVEQLMCSLAVPKEEIAFVAVNGSRASWSQILSYQDEMKLFQLVAGG